MTIRQQRDAYLASKQSQSQAVLALAQAQQVKDGADEDEARLEGRFADTITAKGGEVLDAAKGGVWVVETASRVTFRPTASIDDEVEDEDPTPQGGASRSSLASVFRR